MLEKGFKLEIEDIYQKIHEQRKQKTQNLMFSATIPEWVDKISREYLNKDKKRINLIKNN
jgi:ATP-dependent RNA helicase DDX21